MTVIIHGLRTGINQPFCGKEISRAGLVAATTKVELIDCPDCLKSMSYGGLVDLVNHLPHYRALPNGLECIQVTQWFNFNLGNAIKYIWRAGKKSSDPIEDLKKAQKYLEFEIGRILEHGSES